MAGLVDLRQMTAAEVRTLIVLGLAPRNRVESTETSLRSHAVSIVPFAAEVPAVCGRGVEGRRTMGSTTRRRCMIGRCSCLPTGCRSHNGDSECLSYYDDDANCVMYSPAFYLSTYSLAPTPTLLLRFS